MNNIYKSWDELKTIISQRQLKLQYEESEIKYKLFAVDSSITFAVELWKDTSAVKGINVTQNNIDLQDFEDNFKTNANLPISPVDTDGKQYVRAESRPLDMTTYFTCAGDKIDSPQEIGNGKLLLWDFSNSDNDYDMPSGSIIKMKRITFQFIDVVRLKEGAIYFKNAPKGCYVDMGIWCPPGAYYLTNSGQPVLAVEDTLVSHWVNKHFIIDSCAVGDELNTESASNEIPAHYKFCVGVTTPIEDNLSCGHISLELYRKRTVIL